MFIFVDEKTIAQKKKLAKRSNLLYGNREASSGA